jgi:molybdopterin converting factor small subunit
MGTIIEIPVTLRRFAGQHERVEVQAANVQQALRALAAEHPALAPQLFAADGSLRRIVNIFLNGRHVRQFGDQPAPVQPGDTIHLVPAFAGG